MWGSRPLKIRRRVRVCFDPLKCHIFHSKLLLYNCKFHGIKYGHYHFTDPAYADDATILMSDQLQTVSVLQSMFLLLHWA